MIKAIAIDDEPLALEVIKGMTEKVAFIEVVAYFTSAFEAILFLQKNKVDLLLLDIKMPDLSGMELLKAIPDPPLVIFTTAHSEHAVEGFELDAIDYLLKPFSLTRFLKACHKAYTQLANERKITDDAVDFRHIYIKSGYEQVKIDLDKILYAEANGNYTLFVLGNQKIASRLTMSETEALLPEKKFIRVHRSFIVAKAHIQKIDKKTVWVQQAEIPIGAAYSPDIEKLIQ